MNEEARTALHHTIKVLETAAESLKTLANAEPDGDIEKMTLRQQIKDRDAVIARLKGHA